MKTIWDAVNELKGDLSNTFDYRDESNGLLCFRINDYVAVPKPSGGDIVVCSIKELNALVTEMSLGLDITPINEGYYHKYLAADKQELEPAPVIDWDSAPDEKNYALANKGKGLVEFFREKPVFDGDNSMPCWANHENEVLHLKASWELHERPIKQQPIYTQEMHDNGELPSVGMEVSLEEDTEFFSCASGEVKQLKADDIVSVISVGKRLDNKYTVLTLMHVDAGFCVINPDYVKPIPPKLELIDGEAYQFDYLGEGLLGRHVDGYFINGKTYLAANTCTNIKPLTVKGE